MSEPVQNADGSLNKDAKEYVPTKNRVPKKLDFNLDAKEYKPKPAVEYVEADDDDDEQIQEQLDMIERDMVEQEVMQELGDDESEDEDKWYPKYKDCECCHGFVYKCKGATCQALGQCYCKMKDDCDNVEEDKPKENNNTK